MNNFSVFSSSTRLRSGRILLNKIAQFPNKSARHGAESARRVPDDARAAVGLVRVVLGDHGRAGRLGAAPFRVVPGRLLDFGNGIGSGRG